MSAYPKQAVLSCLLIMCTVMPVHADDNAATGRFAGIPTFSGVSASGMINSNQTFVKQGVSGYGSDYSDDNDSGDGHLAIVDDVYNPDCVVYLQYNEGSGAVQSMAVGTVNVNCN